MKILVATETYPPEINGVARTLAQMVDGLAARGHGIVLVRPRQSRRVPPAEAAGAVVEHEVQGIPLPGYAGLQFGLPAYRLMRRLVPTAGFDAAYIATEGPLGFTALQACIRHRVPALTGMHTNFHQYSAHYGAGILGPLLLRHLRRFHNRSAGTLVPTSTMAGELAAMGFDRMQVWPRGVHTDLFSPGRRDPSLRAAWGLGEDDLAVLYVGRLAPEKNIDTAFAAYQAIRAANDRARFVLVGGGPAERQLRNEHPDAIFVGPKRGEELAAHYASGDLFLFPSETETFGNVTLEAMASGLAVVSYDLAAAHELITHARNGLLATAGDTTAFIDQAVAGAADAELRRTLKIHARETALQQDWPRLINKLETMFSAVCEERASDGLEGAAESTERP